MIYCVTKPIFALLIALHIKMQESVIKFSMEVMCYNQLASFATDTKVVRNARKKKTSISQVRKIKKRFEAFQLIIIWLKKSGLQNVPEAHK